jgi:hypothetical protein
MAPSVDYPDPEPPPMPTIEAVAAPKPTGPVDTPWERLDAQRTAIEIVKPPDELVRPAGPPGIICPACRTENEATRRFCQSCGTPLVVTAPVQQVTPRPARRSMRWLVILIPIVVIAGVLGFGGAALIKPLLPGSSPSTVPSASVGTSAGPTTGTGPPPGSTAPTASAQPPSAHLLAVRNPPTASGHKDAAHGPGKAIDTDPKSAWLQDTTGGLDIWLEFTFTSTPVDITTIKFAGGDQKSAATLAAGRRPRHIEISVDGGPVVRFELDDKPTQDIPVSFHVTKTLRLTIIDNYQGTDNRISGISDVKFVGTSGP